MSDALLSIGAFSRLAHLSVTTLRHYHDIGLLEPADVDGQTGYRRYAPEQAGTAHLIRRLRALDMPLDVVADVVHAADPSQRERFITTHLARMEDELERTRRAVASLRMLLVRSALPDFAVDIRRLPATSAFASSATLTRPDLMIWCAEVYPRLSAAVATAGVTPIGPSGGLYPEPWFRDDAGTVTAYIPVAGSTAQLEASSAGTGMEVIALPATEVAVAVHAGDYTEIDRTYGALGRHVAEAGLDGPGPIVERYLVGPDTSPDPTDWRTEVCWPLDHRND